MSTVFCKKNDGSLVLFTGGTDGSDISFPFSDGNSIINATGKQIHLKSTVYHGQIDASLTFPDNYEITFTADINSPSYSLPENHLYRFPNAITFSSWQGVTGTFMSEYEIRELLKSLPDWSNDGDGSYSSSHEIFIQFGGNINYDRQQEIIRLFNEKGWAIYY